jgi:Lrp/AsnC family transcriptional regulator for asnA, asnC and gidA
MIGIRVKGDPREVAEAVKAFDEIAYVVVTLGSFDVLAEAICETDEDLLELVSTRVRAIPGVAETECFLYAGLHKDFYNWGTR